MTQTTTGAGNEGGAPRPRTAHRPTAAAAVAGDPAFAPLVARVRALAQRLTLAGGQRIRWRRTRWLPTAEPLAIEWDGAPPSGHASMARHAGAAEAAAVMEEIHTILCGGTDGPWGHSSIVLKDAGGPLLDVTLDRLGLGGSLASAVRLAAAATADQARLLGAYAPDSASFWIVNWQPSWLTPGSLKAMAVRAADAEGALDFAASYLALRFPGQAEVVEARVHPDQRVLPLAAAPR